MSTSYTRQDGFADNNGVKLHYIDIAPHAPVHTTPLVLIPGMTTSAELLAEALVPAFPRRCVIAGIRGRGQSDAPQEGYTFAHQVSDIAAVVDYLSLEYFFLYGHSVGAAFSLGFTLDAPQRVGALILGDYPPGYPAFTEAWMERVLAMSAPMAEQAVRGVVREAGRHSLVDRLGELACPVLVLKGRLEDSLLSEKACAVYVQHPQYSVAVLPAAGHDLLQPDASAFVDTIEAFLQAQK